MAESKAERLRMSSNTYKSARSSQQTLQAADEILASLSGEGTPPSLVVVFASPHYADSLQEICGKLNDELAPTQMLGCTGVAIVADDQEIEEDPCLSVWAAWFPDADVQLTRLTYERSPDGGSFAGWPESLVNDWPDEMTLLMLADPFSLPADVFLERLNSDRPGTQVIGGMASGGSRPGEAKLILNGEVFDDGAVVAAVRGARVTPVVSQGCRPIGEPFVITKAERNEIFELGGHKAHEQLKAIYDRLPNRDKELMRLGIHLGRVVNEYQDSFDYGDFLIRNVTGMNAEESSVLVGDYFRAGQTVQFHVRDASTASEDLQQLLNKSREKEEADAKACLLFTCNGRGTRLFEDPHHDAGTVRKQLGELPAAGFFCQGEIGPISGVNFLHGFTASMALFY